MKKLQKLVLPLLLITVVFVIYLFYFANTGSLGSFDDFDPNNNAVKEIRVQLLPERGVDKRGNDFNFYTSDRNGKVIMVSGSGVLPNGFEEADVIILKGHLSGNSFHTHEVLID